MKKILFAAIVLLSLSASAQTAKPVKDSVKIFYLVMPADKWNELIGVVKNADEKPSVIKQWMDIISANVKEVPPQSTKK